MKILPKPMSTASTQTSSSRSTSSAASKAAPTHSRRAHGHSQVDSFSPSTPRGNASAARLNSRLDRLDVQHNSRFQPRGARGTPGRTTYCNQFAQTALRQAGVPTPGGNANSMNHYFNSAEGRQQGWRSVGPAEAQRMANQGHAVTASWRNPTGGHGHIAIVRPGEVGAGGPRIAQAGGHNFNNGSVAQGFGRHAPQYFVHD